MGKFSEMVINPKRYEWNANEPPAEPLFFESPKEIQVPPRKSKADWLREREIRAWKKSPYWSPRITGRSKRTPLSFGSPAKVPGAWRTENREDGW